MTTTIDPLVVRARQRAGAAVLELAGDLDVHGRAAFEEALEAVVEAGARCIAVDVTDLDFVDASGVGVLVGARHRAGRRGAALVVRGSHGPVRRVLDLTGVAGYLEGASPSSIPADIASTIDSSR